MARARVRDSRAHDVKATRVKENLILKAIFWVFLFVSIDLVQSNPWQSSMPIKRYSSPFLLVLELSRPCSWPKFFSFTQKVDFVFLS